MAIMAGQTPAGKASLWVTNTDQTFNISYNQTYGI